VRGLRALLGLVAGVVALLWLATLRVTVVVDPALAAAGDQPWVLSFFHGTLWPLLAWPRRRLTSAVVSLSADGAIAGSALSVLGFSLVRGSSSRGGTRALAAVVRRLREGREDVAFAVDGPKGPRGVAKAGALFAARAGGAVVVPMGSACSWGAVLGTWDRFGLAWPFARVVVVLGAPLTAGPATPDELRRLEGALAEANEKARSCLDRRVAERPFAARFLGIFRGTNVPSRS
jgi:lysophospholipid acyltransferase (LPLAT)-like uncharacterized protein